MSDRPVAVERFLRRPQSAAQWGADAVRAFGIAGVLIAAIWLTPMDAGILALALPVLLVPRFVGVRAWFDIVFCAIVLLAAWSNVLDLYSRIATWDLVMHCVCTGVIAVMTYLAFARLRIVLEPLGRLRRAPLMLGPMIALAVSAVWEMIEWIGWAFVSSDIYVGYQDTIGDMAAGGVGGIAAGVLLAWVPLLRDDARSGSPSEA
ncbi:hypothetical protein G5T42_10640 [Microbacterium sp. 4R-513]|uniref:hypothetical protein n=1 Tax=Microbacterium sp. 4R-513 TaxID=2567934 RepID=UPI0013E1B497|nr:hypothetical protein [Microbacterium sp. 4R-513]QIG39885.1 hypothetical protein G5T42_10640 [Microbacterium sp. 4R-513]